MPPLSLTNSSRDVDVSLAPSMVDNPELFQRQYSTVSAARQANSDISRVLHPIDASRFDFPSLVGIEIEYEGGNQNKIGQELFDAGLTKYAQQAKCHEYLCDSTFPESPNAHNKTWRFEEDGSVTGGEVISPPMLMNEASLHAISQAVNVIVSNRGHVKSRAAGMHIHASSNHLGQNAENWNRLYRIYYTFEDTFYRLAANPLRTGAHRRNSYDSRSPIDISYSTVMDGLDARGNNNRFDLNVNGVDLRGNGHIEFRAIDASLYTPVIQTHILIIGAMMKAAINPNSDVIMDTLEPHPRGYQRKLLEDLGRVPSSKLNGEEWIQATHHIRAFCDMLFPYSLENKEQVATLFAMNKVWPFDFLSPRY